MNTTMTVEWWELRRATVTATHRGWPVTPGTVPGAGICGCPASRGAKAGGTVGEVPEHDKPTPGGRCRLQAAGHRVDDSTWSVQLVIEETEDGCWELHGLGAPKVRLTHPAIAEVATSLLRCAHR